MDSETLGRIEEQRLRLEESLQKLKQSLRHWQTLELDYDALQEEFFPLKENATASECLHAAREAKSDLVNEDELKTLLHDSKGVARRPSQIVQLLMKRSEYVARNVDSLRKQISDTEKNRNVLLLSKNPELQDDAGLPLSEVVEVLDDDGNVLSSRINHPDDHSSNLVEVLQKAGVEGLDTKEDRLDSEVIANSEEPSLKQKAVPAPGPKSVQDEVSTNQAKSIEASDLSQATEEAMKGSTDAVLAPTNPDDTEEDARLRQEMLQYGFDEVGHIVAELELTEDMINGFQEEYEDDEDDDFDDDEESSEDDTGRTKRPVISEDYRKRMKDLQQRLGLKNVGPDPNLPIRIREQANRPTAAEAARKAAIARAEAAQSPQGEKKTDVSKSTEKSASKKKKVAFAANLDIAPEKELEHLKADSSSIPNLLEEIVKRSIPEPLTQTALPSKPVSKFKAARTDTPQTPMFPPPMEFPTQKPTPSGPVGALISENLVERPGTKHALDAPAPDEADFDEELQRRQIASEYHTLRNRHIHAQGGYVHGGEQDNYGDETAAPTIIDENSGRPRKISRFKAARMQS